MDDLQGVQEGFEISSLLNCEPVELLKNGVDVTV